MISTISPDNLVSSACHVPSSERKFAAQIYKLRLLNQVQFIATRKCYDARGRNCKQEMVTDGCTGLREVVVMIVAEEVRLSCL